MPKKSTKPAPTDESQFFVKELAGENPPSFATLKRLYAVATQLYHLAPWRVWTEDKLVLIRDSASGEMCYCSVMGQLGACLGMHAYIGDESYRTFLRLQNGEQVSPGEFLASQHTVYVDFVPMKELKSQDHQLLKALGHPRGAQVGKRRTIDEKVFLPGDVLSHPLPKSLLNLTAFLNSLALIKIAVAAHGEEDHQIPMIALTVAHPERSFVASRLDSGAFGFVEVNQFQ